MTRYLFTVHCPSCESDVDLTWSASYVQPDHSIEIPGFSYCPYCGCGLPEGHELYDAAHESGVYELQRVPFPEIPPENRAQVGEAFVDDNELATLLDGDQPPEGYLQTYRDVEAFRDKHGLHGHDDANTQFNVVVEEVGELAEAVNREAGREEFLEEAADVVYTVLLEAAIQGYRPEEVMAELRGIARENLDKSTSREGGKITKDTDDTPTPDAGGGDD